LKQDGQIKGGNRLLQKGENKVFLMTLFHLQTLYGAE